MNNLKKLWQDPYLRFIVLFIGLYLFLYYFNLLYIGITAKGGIYIPFLAENLNYIEWWRAFSLEATAKLLRLLDYQVLTNDTQLRVVGKHGITLVYECLGYAIMSVFVAFCVTFPSPFKYRYGFLLGGLVIIQFLNICRFAFLSLYWSKQDPLFSIDHHDAFNIFIYTVMAAMCALWLYYSSKNYAKNTPQKRF